MKIIETNINYNIDFRQYFDDKKICFVDIETTGLSRDYNNIYLIGILSYDENIGLWNLKQILAESVDEEKEVLMEAVKFISEFHNIITYNGESFDIPFINKRLELYNIDYSIPIVKSFDLYRLIRENRYYLELENLKLKTIEKMIGIYREDIYSGKDCINFYKDYIKTKDKALESKILKHNYDDLYYLPSILKVIDILNEIKTISITNDLVLMMEEIKIIGDTLVTRGLISENIDIDIIHYDNNYKIVFNEDKFEIEIEYNVGLVSPTEKALFVNKKELALPDNLTDSTNYNIPSNLILLKIEKEFCIDNIKEIVKNLILNALATTLG